MLIGRFQSSVWAIAMTLALTCALHSQARSAPNQDSHCPNDVKLLISKFSDFQTKFTPESSAEIIRMSDEISRHSRTLLLSTVGEPCLRETKNSDIEIRAITTGQQSRCDMIRLVVQLVPPLATLICKSGERVELNIDERDVATITRGRITLSASQEVSADLGTRMVKEFRNLKIAESSVVSIGIGTRAANSWDVEFFDHGKYSRISDTSNGDVLGSWLTKFISLGEDVAWKAAIAKGPMSGAFFPLHTFEMKARDCDRLGDKNTVDLNKTVSGEFLVRWFSKHLAAMGEPSLPLLLAEARVFRFTLLETFDSPVTFRLDVKSNGDATLHVKKTDGKGGYGPGRLVSSKQVQIPKRSVESLLRELYSFNYFEMPQLICDGGLDGARWILEAFDNGKYHVVSRFSPKGDAFAQWCLKLMRLGGEL